ncbi:BTAD domain-containing putative transcriptional regulator [Longimicrobium sp.]|uniref:BTAD domain-containing putative transcriptional regulator n=1 Tax=Longimicrobium sp. TaxID=2029185 RepID=UPI002ED8A2AD
MISPPAPEFTLQLLGSPVLRGREGPVTGRAAHKRRIALLAILALARGRAVGRERLIGLLWPENTAESARHSLSESLYVLRKEVGEGLSSSGDEVRLDPAMVASDVGEFESALEAGNLEGAVRVYAGPLLDGFYVADAPEFERWVDGERDRLARAYARALEQLADAAEAEGSALRAVDWWRALAVHDPYSSRVALRLVRALDAAGERAAALRYASTHAALMREELGVDDDAEMEALVERLRTDPVRTPAPPPPPRFTVGAAAATETAPSDPPPLWSIGGPTGAPALASAGTTDATVDVTVPADAAEDADRPVPTPGNEAGVIDTDAPISTIDRTPPVIAPSMDGDAAPPPPVRPPARRALPRLAGVLGLAAGLLLALLTRRSEPAQALAADDSSDPRRIAVLYFDDHSPGEELRYLASGLTESLIHELSQVEALEVISRNGVKPYRDRAAPFDSLVDALRVGSVVEGSLQRSGDSVFVTVQLIDAATEAHLESRVIGRPMGDVMALQRAVSQEVAASLRRRLGRQVRLRQDRAETESADALALVLQAEQVRDDVRSLDTRRHPVDAGSWLRLLARADSLLAGAEAADPRWARPRLLRGWVAMDRAARAGSERAALVALALQRAGQVLARDPGDARALELRGFAVFWSAVQSEGAAADTSRLEGAERDLRAAVAAEPSLATGWSRLSQVLRYRGRLAEGDLAARRALEEDAWLDGAADVLHRLYSSGVMLEDYRGAGEWCDRGRSQFPDDWRFTECRLTLMREDRSRPADPALAWHLVEVMERVDPPARAAAEGRGYSSIYRRVVAASVSARAGDAQRARAELARARRDAGTDEDLRLSLAYDEAYVRLMLGERAQARRLLDGLVAARPALGGFIRRDPLFRDLFSSAGTAPAASR